MTWEDFRHTVIFRGSWAYGPELMKPGCDHKFSTLYEGMLAGGYDEYDLDRVRTAIFYLRNILVRHGLTGPDKVCVEIGCGTGNKALAVQDLFGHYFGVDPQAEQIDTANRRSRDLSMANTTFIAANAVDVLRKPESFGLPQHIDVLMLYAVIEHLTLDERISIFSTVEGVLARGGRVVVMEAPNRLMAFDAHTTGTHFYNWLPDQMAFEVARRSARGPSLFPSMLQWTDPSSEVHLYRAGRGVSFHDFAGGLPRELARYGFAMNAFSCESLCIDPLQMHELQMFGYLQQHLPDVPAAVFSRSWIDTVMTPTEADTKRSIFLSPHWPRWAVHDEPPIFWHPPSITLTNDGPPWESEPRFDRGGEVVLCFSGDESRLRVWLNDDLLDEFEPCELRKSRPPRGHGMHSVAYEVAAPIRSIRVAASDGKCFFHGAFVHS